MGLKLSSEPCFEKDGHTYYCGLTDDKRNLYIGKARCHPDDVDFESEKVGFTIASRRALMKAIKHYIKNEIKPKLKAFKNLYTSMQTSTHFNYKSYEAKRLYKEIKNIEAELEAFNEMLLFTEEELTTYLTDKELFLKKIKKIRDKGENK